MEFSPGQDKLTKKVKLQRKGHPESFAELMVELSPGEGIDYSWRAEGEVEFNIHSHHGKDVEYFEKSTSDKGSGRFTGPADDHYYLMWMNRSTEPIEVSIKVDR